MINSREDKIKREGGRHGRIAVEMERDKETEREREREREREKERNATPMRTSTYLLQHLSRPTQPIVSSTQSLLIQATTHDHSAKQRKQIK